MSELKLRQAKRILSKGIAYGRDRNLKPLAIVVLDPGGHPKAFEREDGASPGRYAVAMGKAYGCLMLGMGGSAMMARAEQQAYFMAAMNGLFGGRVVPVPGGVLVRDRRGQIIGAVGVSGDVSENDAAAAVAGIEAAGLTAEP
ncbi:MAG: heme-binding protein [Paracoccaceae bacterium]|nr:heme-binding protein [Paracoccaceae bacterium]MDE2915273.1 heme-binding protein [Paracoccaceae bacterium]